MADLPKPAHYWRDDVPGRAGPLLSPLFTAAQLEAYAAAKVAEERDRLCAAIKAADDKAVDEADYMLTSDDCISVIRGAWTGFEHVAAIRGTEAASRGET